MWPICFDESFFSNFELQMVDDRRIVKIIVLHRLWYLAEFVTKKQCKPVETSVFRSHWSVFTRCTMNISEFQWLKDSLLATWWLLTIPVCFFRLVFVIPNVHLFAFCSCQDSWLLSNFLSANICLLFSMFFFYKYENIRIFGYSTSSFMWARYNDWACKLFFAILKAWQITKFG